ncbi:hypothetical protein MMC29_005268, partial [Sticta canariensis]|nr:hypothetical protein [Sticta canariensis]
AFLTPEFWEAVPTADPSAPVSVPPPTTAFSFSFDEEEEPGFEIPPAEEPTAEELLWELWWLLKQPLLCLTLSIEDFMKENPYLRSEKISCRLRRLKWPIPTPTQSHSRGRSVSCYSVRPRFAVRTRAISGSPALPSAPGPAPAPVAAPSSPIPPPFSPPSPPSAFFSPAPLALLPPASPPPLALPPASLPPSTLSGSPAPLTPTSPAPSASSTDQSCRPSIIERVRWQTERRESRQRIHELEQKVKELYSQLEVMGRHAPLLSSPQPPQLPPVQPVLVTGSASGSPQPTQPVLVTGSTSTLSLPRTAVLAAPFEPLQSSFWYAASPPPPQPLSFRYPSSPSQSSFWYAASPPPPQPLSFRYPSSPLCPDQLSFAEFLERYPLTGRRLGS